MPTGTLPDIDAKEVFDIFTMLLEGKRLVNCTPRSNFNHFRFQILR